MNKLFQLKQTSIVVEYRIAFEASAYHLLSLTPHWTTSSLSLNFYLDWKMKFRELFTCNPQRVLLELQYCQELKRKNWKQVNHDIEPQPCLELQPPYQQQWSSKAGDLSLPPPFPPWLQVTCCALNSAMKFLSTSLSMVMVCMCCFTYCRLTRKDPNCRVRYLPHPRPVDNCLARITKFDRSFWTLITTTTSTWLLATS